MSATTAARMVPVPNRRLSLCRPAVVLKRGDQGLIDVVFRLAGTGLFAGNRGVVAVGHRLSKITRGRVGRGAHIQPGVWTSSAPAPRGRRVESQCGLRGPTADRLGLCTLGEPPARPRASAEILNPPRFDVIFRIQDA
jgi:hypothetical protein